MDLLRWQHHMSILAACIGCRLLGADRMGGLQGGLCGKKLGRLHARNSWFQSAAGRSWARQPRWWHIQDNIFKRGQNIGFRSECESSSLADEVFQVLEQRFPWVQWRRPWWSRLSFCSPWRTMAKQIFIRQPVKDCVKDCSTQDVAMHWKKLQPVESPYWVSLWGTVPCGKSPCWIMGKVWGGRGGRDEMLWSDHNLHFPVSPVACGEAR